VASGGNPNYGAGIYMTGGTVTNCVVRGNQGGANNTYGGGIWLNSGRVTRSTISGNSLASSDRCHGGGIDMYGGTVDFCTISNNSLANSIYGSTYGEGNKGGAGMVVFGGLVRNCLLMGNQNDNNTGVEGDHGGGMTLLGGAVENCTIVRNKTRSTGGGLYLTTGTVTNTIIYHNGATVSSNVNTAVGFAYSCAPELTADVNGNRVADPLFEATGAGYGLTCTPGDYRLKPRSPCANGGTNSVSWMTNAVDLAGGPRILNNIVDMGAYEVQLLPPGSVFRFR
jgi:hypothetical protein